MIDGRRWGEGSRKLELDTQSDVSRRAAAIVSISFQIFIELLVSLEGENEGLIQPGHDGLDSRCLCWRVSCTYGSPMCGSRKKCRSTSTMDTSLHIVLCGDNTVC